MTYGTATNMTTGTANSTISHTLINMTSGTVLLIWQDKRYNYL